MKTVLVFLAAVFLALACNKEDSNQPPAHPVMRYTDLNNVTVKFGQHKFIELDGNNSVDLLFSTVLVGDPVYKRDKRKYFVNASFDVFSLVNEQEETPALNNNDNITINHPAGYNWYNANSIVLAEKIIEETGAEHWEGNWKNTSHKYLPVQIRKNELRFNGWVELSFRIDTEEIVLHRSAIAVESGKDVRAGK